MVIQNCSFITNGHNARPKTIERIFKDFHMKGGGLQVIISNRQNDSVYNITDCMFWNNTASDGGGLFLVIHEGAQDNSVIIEDTVFEHNKCENSGGGLKTTYMRKGEEISMTKNSVTIRKCRFLNNNAPQFGGGTAFLSSQGLLNNSITFNGCHWEGNSASFGTAVDISIVPSEKLSLEKKYLPSPLFFNCVFIENVNLELSDASTLAITGFRVQFSSKIAFERNSGSCIEATYTTLYFLAGSNASFQENYAIRGAAIKINDFSVIEFQDNSIFWFSKNRASKRGGAIYVRYTNKHTFFSPHEKCFLNYVGKEKGPRNVTFEFESNYAGRVTENDNQGDSMYITYITPCIEKCILSFIHHQLPILDEGRCLGDFVFDEQSSERKPIATSASYFVRTEKGSLNSDGCQKVADSNNDSVLLDKKGATYFIPGKSTKLPLKLMNDLGDEMLFKVSVTVNTKNSGVSLNPAYAYTVITSTSLILYGKPKEIACIRLSALEIRKFDFTFKVLMDECPPGYVYNISSMKCVCSNRNIYYSGIKICNDIIFQASIQFGYWIGYIPDINKTKGWSLDLASAICPRGYCIRNSSEHITSTKLPLNASEDISRSICSKGRTGVVCGSCRENHSAYYNSEYFNCGNNDLCHLGWLFYILSELVPVTILFLIVIVFNISFTSGPLNGVIFFMQMTNTLKIHAGNFIWFEIGAYRLKQIHRLLYMMFNLDFFDVGLNLSFCLWEGANALDLLAFRYVTILYSLILVVVTVFLLRKCNCTFCGKPLPNFQGSIIHGLSAFLVMSYSVCTRVSLLILTPSTLHIGPDYKNNPQYKYVAYYNGDYTYMGSEHLRYAIPAIFFILTVAIIPPLFLFSYPLCYKLFALLKVEESKFVQITCKIIPLEKIKPFFDSMQGAFIDRYRFFAGLYFLYRLVCLLSFALSSTFTIHYTLTGLFLALMLAAHGAYRPYKKGWQNILEASLLFNLFVINSLTFYNYYHILPDQTDTYNSVVLPAVQNVLILLPLLYLVSYTAYCVFVNIRSLCRQHQLAQETSDDSDAILFVLDKRDSDSDCEEEAVEMTEYKLM